MSVAPARRFYGLILLAAGLFETAWVAFVGVVPVPWAYLALVGPFMVLVGGALITMNVVAGAGSRVAAAGAGIITIWFVGMAGWALRTVLVGSPAAPGGDAVKFFGLVAILVLVVDWAAYRAISTIRTRRDRPAAG